MSLRVNGKRIFKTVLSKGSSAWFPYSGTYRTWPNETKIEISIVDEIDTLRGNDLALDNIIFKEISSESIHENKAYSIIQSKSPSPLGVWNEIESVFRSFITDSDNQRSCSFKYRIGSEPDVCVFDSKYKTMHGVLTKVQVLKVVSYYLDYCRGNNKNGGKTIKEDEINDFLTDNLYSIKLIYSTTEIVCLIYDGKKYLFFEM
jgi:hypothetical protein